MSLASDLPAELQRISRERTDTEAFIKLRDFYAQMIREGVAIKKGYELPPLDTIGRTLRQDSGTP